MASVSSKKQKILLQNLISDVDLFAICNNIIQPDYFDPEYRPAVSFILDYYNQYNNIPTIDVIDGETAVVLDNVGKLLSDEFQYSADNIVKFCKERAVLREVINAHKYIEKDDLGTLVEQLTKAVQISLFHDLGTDVLSQVADRLKARQTEHISYSTGWSDLDKELGDGIRLTEMILFSANSGGGKSVALSNFALAMIKQGLDVLYISLELQEDMICDRFETMATKWNKATKFERMEETASIVEGLRHENGASIYVKYMEAEVTNSNAIKAYLKQFEMRHKKLPKVLIVDYLDIFGTNEKMSQTDVFTKDKLSSTQLRAIGNNPIHPMIMATASQQNRSAVGETEMNHSHIAGGLSKVNISDVYVSIVMTDTMRAQGIAEFMLLKTRSSGGVGHSVRLTWDPISLRFEGVQQNSIPTEKPNITKSLSPNSVSDLDELLLM